MSANLPDVTIDIESNGLGNVAPVNTGLQAKVGICSIGTPNVPQSFGDPTVLQKALGTGPLVDAAVDVLGVAGGQVIVLPLQSNVAGNVQPMTGGDGAVSLSGTPSPPVMGCTFPATLLWSGRTITWP